MRKGSFGILMSLLVVLALCRGSSYGFTKLALGTMTSSDVLFLRMAVGAVALTLWACLSVRSLGWVASDWRCAMAYAILGNALPLALITVAQKWVASGLAAVTMAATPLVCAVLAHLMLPNERLTLRGVFGLLLGLAGVLGIVLVRGGVQLGPDALIGLTALFGAAVAFAGNVVLARAWQPTQQMGTGALSLILATVAVYPFCDVDAGLVAHSWDALMACVLLGVISTAMAVVAMLELAKRASASFISTVNYMIPVIGLAIGWMFFGEPLFWSDLAALIVIVLGTSLVQNRNGTERKPWILRAIERRT
ncbi:putative DMT superfamily transporter inner membrane protein [Variovorax boronicumulans]|nr:putative DMT superfamily transporter inner membrane protein [Variovorax boronicumulans]